MSFFFCLPFSFNLFGFQTGFRRCVRVRVCTHTVFQPCGHASGTSSYHICHCLDHVASIFCIQVPPPLLRLEGQTLSPVSVTPFLLSSLYICQTQTLPFLSRLPSCHHLSFISLKSQQQQQQYYIWYSRIPVDSRL